MFGFYSKGDDVEVYLIVRAFHSWMLYIEAKLKLLFIMRIIDKMVLRFAGMWQSIYKKKRKKNAMYINNEHKKSDKMTEKFKMTTMKCKCDHKALKGFQFHGSPTK